MRLSTDKTTDRLGRRLLRLHISEVSEEAELALPGDSKAIPPGLVLFWLLTIAGLLLSAFAIT